MLGLTGSIAWMSGRATILNLDKSRELLQAAWTCDPGLLNRDTGWEAVFDIGAGTEATAAWCRQEGVDLTVHIRAVLMLPHLRVTTGDRP